jgi:AP-1-like factor
MQLLTPHREKISACPKVQNGTIDMDDLCSQLKDKAKCSGDGLIISNEDFKEVITKIGCKETDKGLV